MHRDQLSRRRDQETGAGAARDGCRLELSGLDRLPKRCGQDEPVQLDPERRSEQLGIVPATESRRQLTQARAARANDDLGVGGSEIDPERRRRAGGDVGGLLELALLER